MARTRKARLPVRLVTIAAAVVTPVALLLSARTARAGGMDPTPERLVLQPPGLPAGSTCQDIAAHPETAVAAGSRPGNFPCRPDNVAFRNLVSELGFAIAPSALHPARTTGFGGFALTLETSFTHVNADDFSTAQDGSRRQYWHDGTRGSVDSASKRYSTVNNSPDSLIGIYTLKARKGLPLGFEITGALGYVSNTTLWTFGADVRWAVLEGFRKGPVGYLPDVSIGGGVRTLTGSSKLFLTTVGIDVQISKPITLADSATLSPFIGYQRLIVFGNSAVVDTTPNTDALRECGYQGPDPTTGEPRCTKTVGPYPNNGDFNNNVTFDSVRTHRHRGAVGLAYKYEILYLAGQFLFDLTSPDSENAGLSTTRQYTVSLEAGVSF